MIKPKTFLNFALFQLGWWGTFAAAVYRLPLLLLALFITAILTCHFFTTVERAVWRRDLGFFVLVATFGYLIDSTWSYFNLLQFSENPYGFAPLWLIGMWLTFPMAIGHSFAWLEGRPLTTFIFAAIGAPLCYRFGENFDLIRFESISSMLLYGLYWGLLLTALVKLKQQPFFAAPS